MKKMENKYFTPDIEDICIGYECEVYSIGLQMINDRLLPDDERDNELKWRPRIIKCGSDILSLEAHSYQNEDELYKSFKILWKNYIRVPYLTKEQIEAEGWSFETVLFADDDENDVYSDGFAKHIDQDHWYEMVLRKDNKIHIVYKWYRNSVAQLWRDVYSGNCKDINTFRKITKLLKI